MKTKKYIQNNKNTDEFHLKKSKLKLVITVISEWHEYGIIIVTSSRFIL